ncbi:hypothetical protein QBC39DRAFT_177159 [Podospora conica]|nr:hypothetical protein QBC39DRAFT_177159 [Schizothecium conicum]
MQESKLETGNLTMANLTLGLRPPGGPGGPGLGHGLVHLGPAGRGRPVPLLHPQVGRNRRRRRRYESVSLEHAGGSARSARSALGSGRDARGLRGRLASLTEGSLTEVVRSKRHGLLGGVELWLGSEKGGGGMADVGRCHIRVETIETGRGRHFAVVVVRGGERLMRGFWADGEKNRVQTDSDWVREGRLAPQETWRRGERGRGNTSPPSLTNRCRVL